MMDSVPESESRGAVEAVRGSRFRPLSAGSVPRLLGPPLAALSVGLWLYFVSATLGDVIGKRGMIDFAAYWDAGRAVLGNSSPYGPAAHPSSPVPFAYPPIFAIAMIPFSLLPLGTAEILWYVLSLAFLAGGCAGVLRLVDTSQSVLSIRTLALPAIAITTFLFYLVWTNAKLGQVDALVFFLVIGSLTALSTGRPTLGGALLGTAVAFKIIPVPVIAYALWVGWRRLGLCAIAMFLGLQFVSATLVPGLMVEYWLQEFLAITPRVTQNSTNLAVTSLVVRIAPELSPILWPIAATFSALVILVPFALAWRIRDWQALVHALALLIAGTAIAGPVVENHHMVWLLLPIWVLLASLARRQDLLGLGLLGGIFLLLSQPYRLLRFLGAVVPPLSTAESQGGVVLELGAVLLYLLLLATTVKQLIVMRRASHHPTGQAVRHPG